MNWYKQSESWSFILRRYLPSLMFYSLVWEIVQLPLYTLWAEPRWELIAFSVVHCTVGDAIIATVALILALILNRAGKQESWPWKRIDMLIVCLTVIYTVLSERINLARGNWAYSSWMPVLPWIEVGLAPVAQWIIVPLVTLLRVNRRPFHAPRHN